MKVLVDTSVLRDAIVGDWTTRDHTVEWGGTSVTTPVVVMRRRPMPPPDQLHRRNGILALPTISRLAGQGRLQLVTYEELNAEYLVGRNPAVATRGDLFRAIRMEMLEPAVSRSFFQQLPLDEYWTKEAITSFLRRLLEIKSVGTLAHLVARKNVPQMTQRSLTGLERFRWLCQHAPDKLLSDLFHIWTGEQNGCAYFLTMERKICNWVTTSLRDSVLCMPIRPDGLLHKLDIADYDPMPFEEGSFLSYVEAMEG